MTASILLDLDGTLIDSEPGILSSCRAALHTLGHDLDPATDLSPMIGPPIEEGMGWLLQRFGDDRVAQAVAAYRADYAQSGLYHSPAYLGIADGLRALRQAGYTLYVATSKRRVFAQRILDHLDLAALFNGIHGSEDGGALDHKPALIGHVIAQHDLNARRCLMVGDRRYDIEGAKANQMRALGVLWGYGTREELVAAGADGLVAQTSELAAAVRSLLEPSA